MPIETKPIQTVVFVPDHGGPAPFDVWFNALRDMKVLRTVVKRLATVRAGSLGDTKSVGDGVHELRIDVGEGHRIYYGRRGQTLVILLGGGSKKTQATDIKKAKAYWKEYQSAH